MNAPLPTHMPHPLFEDVGEMFWTIARRAELADGCCVVGDSLALEHFCRALAEDLRRAIPLVKALRMSSREDAP